MSQIDVDTAYIINFQLRNYAVNVSQQNALTLRIGQLYRTQSPARLDKPIVDQMQLYFFSAIFVD